MSSRPEEISSKKVSSPSPSDLGDYVYRIQSRITSETEAFQSRLRFSVVVILIITTSIAGATIFFSVSRSNEARDDLLGKIVKMNSDLEATKIGLAAASLTLDGLTKQLNMIEANQKRINDLAQTTADVKANLEYIEHYKDDLETRKKTYDNFILQLKKELETAHSGSSEKGQGQNNLN